MNLKIPSYSLSISLGFIISVLIAFKIEYKNGNLLNLVLTILAISLGSLLGSKLLYFLLYINKINWKESFSSLQTLNELFNQGFVFYGGMIGSILVLFILSNVLEINLFERYSNLVFLIPFAHAFGRCGCFLAGCCYGKPYSGIFSVKYPKESFAPQNIELFPIQLVEAVLLLLLSLFLYLFFARKNKDGIIAYLISYALIRFILEFFRGDIRSGFNFILSPSQVISILILITSLSYLLLKSKQNKISSTNFFFKK